jgi:hypothetical protein
LIDVKCSGCFINVFIDEEDAFYDKYFKKFFKIKNYEKFIVSNISAYGIDTRKLGDMYVWISLKWKCQAKYK